MTFRPGPLRAAAILAAGFVVARVAYRVLFHGADGDGVVLLDLPAIRLPSPFAHVVLLGPVTADGLVDAAAGALPIALCILAFGVLNAAVDLNRVFARAARRGPLRGIARALAVAAATLPSLADGARAVRFARRLRGERGGPRMLLPLLERTLERAGGVAAALELRGFAGRGLDGDCRAPVEAQGVELGFGRIEAATGRGIRLPSELVLDAGTLTLVSGPTGSGKSTLLRAIAGLHSHTDGGWIAGSLRIVGHARDAVPPRDLAQRVGVVLQHPRDAFATERVRDEIGLALELRGVAPVIVGARVAEVADRVGVTALLDRPTRGLSAGEATLVAIAAAIVEHPILVLVDEPLADLDADARLRITKLLDALAHAAGMCVVVAEHRVAPLSSIADTVLRIEGGVVRVAPDLDVHPVSGRTAAARGGPDAPRTSWMRAEPQEDGAAQPVGARSAGGLAGRGDPDPVLRARGVTVRHSAVVAVDSVDLELDPGEIVALLGPNGAGKSSLLAGLALPARGAHIEAAGRVALVPDASDDLFVYDTVAAECARADRHVAKARRARRQLGGDGLRRNEDLPPSEERSPRSDPHLGASPHLRGSAHETTAARFAGFLGLDPDGPDLAARLARHPRDLSVGERRCLALAIQLAGDPAVLLVDEPTRGLDPAARTVVWRVIRGLTESGTAVLVASHEPESADLADRVLRMEAGVLSVASTAASRSTTPPERHVTSRVPGSQAPSAATQAELWIAPPPAVRHPRQAELRTAPPPAVPRPGQAELWPALPPTVRHPRQAELRTAPPLAVRHPRQSATWPLARSAAGRLSPVALVAANLVALGAFCWPLVATAVPQQAYAAVPIAALALAPLAVLVVIATLDATVRSAHLLALLGTLAAIGAAVRIASTGVGGVEAVFILLILAGSAYGARFGMLLGMATIALSTLVTGTFGPWTPFQMFACAWVGAVAGLLPRRLSRRTEIAMLCTYGVVASYAFGLLMNLWFWPFAVGYGTGISYEPGAAIGTNLSSFLLYSLVTSTLSWDTLRAITTVVGLVVVGRPILAALRRAKPLSSVSPVAAVARRRVDALR